MGVHRGSPYNVLKDLARLGARFPLEAVGLVGADDAGRFILWDCEKHGIHTEQLRVSKSRPTSYTDVITDQATGRRRFFHCRGANADLGPEHFDLGATRAWIFHLVTCSFSIASIDWASRCRQAGDDCVSRAAGCTGTADESLGGSGQRAQRMFRARGATRASLRGLSFSQRIRDRSGHRDRDHPEGRVDGQAVEQAADQLMQIGLKGWVFVHFPAAVYACSAQGPRIWQPALAVPNAYVRGVAGAGDALASGIFTAWHEGWPVAQFLQLGVCAAGASLSHPTCSEGVQTVDDCRA